MQSGGTARALRAALFALVCVGTGTGLHLLANGCDPGWVGPGLALPLVWLGAFGLARKERSMLSVTTSIALAQLGLHLELGLFCPKVATMPGMPGMPGATSAASHGTLAMILAHTVAILVCGWWLGCGEKSFFDLCRTVALIVAPAADLLAGRLTHVHGILPPLPVRRGIHVTAPRTTCPAGGPAPSPRLLRGPPALPGPRTLRRFQPITIM
jgi:hypothetical protein